MAENQFIQEILERMVRIETKLDNYNAVKEKTEEAYSTSRQNSKDIDEIKDSQKWLWRTTVGAIITTVGSITVAVITMFIKFQ